MPHLNPVLRGRVRGLCYLTATVQEMEGLRIEIGFPTVDLSCIEHLKRGCGKERSDVEDVKRSRTVTFPGDQV
jgi:hypothetical protein